MRSTYKVYIPMIKFSQETSKTKGFNNILSWDVRRRMFKGIRMERLERFKLKRTTAMDAKELGWCDNTHMLEAGLATLSFHTPTPNDSAFLSHSLFIL